ncbi:MAG: hypothetical protein ABI988_14115, partial [Nitrospirota bacterium]
SHLLAHLLRLEVFDHLPVQPGFLGDILDRHAPATPSHEEGDALGVERVAASHSSFSCFTLPHRVQWTRRISNSR